MTDQQKKWALVHEALRDVMAEYRGKWPEPIKRSRHMGGYSRERGRRPVIQESGS